MGARVWAWVVWGAPGAKVWVWMVWGALGVGIGFGVLWVQELGWGLDGLGCFGCRGLGLRCSGCKG